MLKVSFQLPTLMTFFYPFNIFVGMSSDVREFCVEEGCLKKFLRLYFAGSQEEVESLASEWCCGNCDL